MDGLCPPFTTGTGFVKVIPVPHEVTTGGVYSSVRGRVRWDAAYEARQRAETIALRLVVFVNADVSALHDPRATPQEVLTKLLLGSRAKIALGPGSAARPSLGVLRELQAL